MVSCITARDGSELPTLCLHGKNGFELRKGVQIQCVEIIGAGTGIEPVRPLDREILSFLRPTFKKLEILLNSFKYNSLITF